MQRHSAEAHSPCQECYPWFTEAAIEGKRQPLICASGGESQLMKWIPVYPAVGPSEAVVEEESVTNHKLFCTTRSWGRSSLPTIFIVPSEQGARAQVLSERARRHSDSSKDESMNEQDFYSFKDNSVSVNYSADTPHLYCSVIELHAVIETEDAQHQTQAVFCQNSTAAPISETTSNDRKGPLGEGNESFNISQTTQSLDRPQKATLSYVQRLLRFPDRVKCKNEEASVNILNAESLECQQTPSNTAKHIVGDEYLIEGYTYDNGSAQNFSPKKANLSNVKGSKGKGASGSGRVIKKSVLTLLAAGSLQEVGYELDENIKRQLRRVQSKKASPLKIKTPKGTEKVQSVPTSGSLTVNSGTGTWSENNDMGETINDTKSTSGQLKPPSTEGKSVTVNSRTTTTDTVSEQLKTFASRSSVSNFAPSASASNNEENEDESSTYSEYTYTSATATDSDENVAAQEKFQERQANGRKDSQTMDSRDEKAGKAHEPEENEYDEVITTETRSDRADRSKYYDGHKKKQDPYNRAWGQTKSSEDNRHKGLGKRNASIVETKSTRKLKSPPPREDAGEAARDSMNVASSGLWSEDEMKRRNRRDQGATSDLDTVTSRSNRQSRSANRSGSVAITDEERAQRTSSYKKKSDDNPNLEKKTMSEADMWSDKEMDANVSSKSIVKNTRSKEEGDSNSKQNGSHSRSEDKLTQNADTRKGSVKAKEGGSKARTETKRQNGADGNDDDDVYSEYSYTYAAFSEEEGKEEKLKPDSKKQEEVPTNGVVAGDPKFTGKSESRSESKGTAGEETRSEKEFNSNNDASNAAGSRRKEGSEPTSGSKIDSKTASQSKQGSPVKETEKSLAVVSRSQSKQSGSRKIQDSSSLKTSQESESNSEYYYLSETGEVSKSGSKEEKTKAEDNRNGSRRSESKQSESERSESKQTQSKESGIKRSENKSDAESGSKRSGDYSETQSSNAGSGRSENKTKAQSATTGSKYESVDHSEDQKHSQSNRASSQKAEEKVSEERVSKRSSASDGKPPTTKSSSSSSGSYYYGSVESEKAKAPDRNNHHDDKNTQSTADTRSHLRQGEQEPVPAPEDNNASGTAMPEKLSTGRTSSVLKSKDETERKSEHLRNNQKLENRKNRVSNSVREKDESIHEYENETKSRDEMRSTDRGSKVHSGSNEDRDGRASEPHDSKGSVTKQRLSEIEMEGYDDDGQGGKGYESGMGRRDHGKDGEKSHSVVRSGSGADTAHRRSNPPPVTPPPPPEKDISNGETPYERNYNDRNANVPDFASEIDDGSYPRRESRDDRADKQRGQHKRESRDVVDSTPVRKSQPEVNSEARSKHQSEQRDDAIESEKKVEMLLGTGESVDQRRKSKQAEGKKQETESRGQSGGGSETSGAQNLEDSSYDLGSKLTPSWDKSENSGGGQKRMSNQEPFFSEWQSEGNAKKQDDRAEQPNDTYMMPASEDNPSRSNLKQPKSGDPDETYQELPIKEGDVSDFENKRSRSDEELDHEEQQGHDGPPADGAVEKQNGETSRTQGEGDEAKTPFLSVDEEPVDGGERQNESKIPRGQQVREAQQKHFDGKQEAVPHGEEVPRQAPDESGNYLPPSPPRRSPSKAPLNRPSRQQSRPSSKVGPRANSRAKSTAKSRAKSRAKPRPSMGNGKSKMSRLSTARPSKKSKRIGKKKQLSSLGNRSSKMSKASTSRFGSKSRGSKLDQMTSRKSSGKASKMSQSKKSTSRGVSWKKPSTAVNKQKSVVTGRVVKQRQSVKVDGQGSTQPSASVAVDNDDAQSATTTNAQPYLLLQMLNRDNPEGVDDVSEPSRASGYTLHSLGVGENQAKCGDERFKHVKSPIIGPAPDQSGLSRTDEKGQTQGQSGEPRKGGPVSELGATCQGPPAAPPPSPSLRGEKDPAPRSHASTDVKGKGRGRGKGEARTAPTKSSVTRSRATGENMMQFNKNSRSKSKSPQRGKSPQKARSKTPVQGGDAPPLVVEPPIEGSQKLGPRGRGGGGKRGKQKMGLASATSRTTMIAKPEMEVTPMDQVYDMTDDMYELSAPSVKSSQLPPAPPRPKEEGQLLIKNTYITHYVDGDGSLRVNQSDTTPLQQTRAETAEPTEHCYSSLGTYDRANIQWPSPTQGSSISFHTANGSKLAGTPYQTPRSPANIRGTSVTTIEVRSFGSSRPSTSQTTSQTKQIANQSAQTSPRKGRGRAGVRGRSQASAARAPTPTHHLGPGQDVMPTVSVSDTQTGTTYNLHSYGENYLPTNDRVSQLTPRDRSMSPSCDMDDFQTARRSLSNELPPQRKRRPLATRMKRPPSRKGTPKTKHMNKIQDQPLTPPPQPPPPPSPPVPRLNNIGSPRDFGEEPQATRQTAGKRVAHSDKNAGSPSCSQPMKDGMCDSCRKSYPPSQMTHLCDKCRDVVTSGRGDIRKGPEKTAYPEAGAVGTDNSSTFCSICDFTESCSICRQNRDRVMRSYLLQSERANVTDSPQNQASFISAAVIKVRRVSNYGDEEPGYNSSDDLSPVDAEDGPTFFVKMAEKLERYIWGGDPSETYLEPKREAYQSQLRREEEFARSSSGRERKSSEAQDKEPSMSEKRKSSMAQESTSSTAEEKTNTVNSQSESSSSKKNSSYSERGMDDSEETEEKDKKKSTVRQSKNASKSASRRKK